MPFRSIGPARGKSKNKTGSMVEQLETRQLLTGTLASTVAITDTSPYIQLGGTETFTATISPAISSGPTPTGTVQFFSYNGTYPSQTVNVDSSGRAQLQLTGTIAGYMAFIAQYSGDANYAATDSQPGTAVVNAQVIQPSLTKTTVPTQIVQNGAARGTDTVVVYNPTGIKFSGKEAIFISALRYLGGSFSTTVVGRIDRNVVLGPGASKSYVVPVNMKLADAVVGSYSLLPTVFDSPGNGSYEISAGPGVNPVVTVSAPFVDLSAALTTVTPRTGSAYPGRTVSVSLEIFNHGNVAATGLSTTSFAASNNLDGSAAVFVGNVLEHIHIAAGRHQFFRVTSKIPIGSIPGTYYLVANIDTLNALNETDLTNNTAVSPTTLTVLDPYPNILGGYTGTWTIKRGPDKGMVTTQTGTFTDEDNTTGAWASNGTNFFSNGTTAATSGIGTITPAGVWATDKVPGYTVYSIGRLKHGVIRGNFYFTNGDTGTFAWTLTG
jgi:hypothetical protein